MPIPAVIETSNPFWLRVRTPYNAAFVAAIKELPKSARKFDNEQKCWLVSPLFLDHAKQLCEKFYGEVEITDGSKKPQPKPVPKGTRFLGGASDCDHDWAKSWKMAVVERCDKCGQWKSPPLRTRGDK